MKNNIIAGIDLGTTNSALAIFEAGSPIIIPNAEGGRTTPSVVAYSAAGETLVGLAAKRQAIINQANTFSSVKRFIGCKYNQIVEDINKISYSIKEDVNGNIKLSCPILSKDISPEEISAAILKKLVRDANKFAKNGITQAIITVPAYFNDSQRLATKDAGTIAGLEVLRILNEPTAAALAYGLANKKNETILVFDLGGGTFDVSVLEVGEQIFEVLATSGDTHLGGDDFDQALVKYIIDTFKNEENINLYEDKQALQRIIEAAERAKIELSMLQLTRINLPFICVRNNDPKHIDLNIDRSKFEALSKNLLERCKQPVLKALDDAKLPKGKIDKIILVGGSTRIPAVRELVTNLVGKPLNETVNPDEVVALGAAVQAGIIAGKITDVLLLDVTPLTLGIETLDGIVAPIIKRNSPVPGKYTETFSTATDNQTLVEINVLQGERMFAKDNKSLGLFTLEGIPEAKKGVPQIIVTFQLDADGILSVLARDEKTGIEQSIKIEGASTLSREEVSTMLESAESYALADQSKKTVIAFAYELDNILLKADHFIKLSASYKHNFLKKLKELYIKKQFSKVGPNFLKYKKNVANILIDSLWHKKFIK